MEFFLDTADLSQIKQMLALGIIDGITTNPSLLAEQNAASFNQLITQISQIVPGPVSVEVSANDYETMLTQGGKILTIAKNIILKLPTTWDGIKACHHFSNQGHKVNMTLCFSVNQALLAAKAGAYCVSPFIGRLEDTGHDGMHFLGEIVSVFKNYPNIKTKVLASSIRTPMHLHMAAKIGADIATMSSDVILKLINNPLTQIGLEKFNEDWKKSNLVI